MELGIKGEAALVVGASEGIGNESAKALLEEGTEVLICSRNAGKLKRAASFETPGSYRVQDVLPVARDARLASRRLPPTRRMSAATVTIVTM